MCCQNADLGSSCIRVIGFAISTWTFGSVIYVAKIILFSFDMINPYPANVENMVSSYQC